MHSTCCRSIRCVFLHKSRIQGITKVGLKQAIHCAAYYPRRYSYRHFLVGKLARPKERKQYTAKHIHHGTHRNALQTKSFESRESIGTTMPRPFTLAPQQEAQRCSKAFTPRSLCVIRARIVLRYPGGRSITPLCHHCICLALELRIKRVQRLIAAVEIHTMGTGYGQVIFHVGEQYFRHRIIPGTKTPYPMCGDARCAAKHIRIFT